jgi:hypothetical protein
MTCHQIRQLIPSVARSQTGLTEWALVEAHVKQCAGCRAEQERVETQLDSGPVARVWALADSVTGFGERIHGRGSDIHDRVRFGRPFRGPAPVVMTAPAPDPEVEQKWAALAPTRTFVISQAIRTRGDRLRERFRLRLSTVRRYATQRGADLRDTSLAVLLGPVRLFQPLRSAMSGARRRAGRSTLAAVESGRHYVARGSTALRTHASFVRLRTGAAGTAGLAAVRRGGIQMARVGAGLGATLSHARPGLTHARAATLAAVDRGRVQVARVGADLRATLSRAHPHVERARAGALAAVRHGSIQVAHAGAALRSGGSRAGTRVAQAGVVMIESSHAQLARAAHLRFRVPALPSIPIPGAKAILAAGVAMAMVVLLTLHEFVPVPSPRATSESAGPAVTSPPETRSVAAVATPPPKARPSRPHVVGRLTVKDRSASERELAELLARTGGAQVGGRHEVTTTIVDAIVPSAGYREFVRGLAGIGSWHVEAERSPLPRAVRMIIRMDG